MGLVAFAFCGTAAAQPSPGDSIVPIGMTVADDPTLAGVIEKDESRKIFCTGLYGTLQTRVVRSTITGNVDFYFRVTNAAPSSGPIVAVYVSDFTNAAWNARSDYRVDGVGTVPPTRINRSSSPGDTFSFHFLSWPLAPGESSRQIYVQSLAKNYDRSGYALIVSDRASCLVYNVFRPVP
ncbi:hypothetical protein [Pendulispora albinea]|uniref:Secreted protein n=1 Tax=Pendulispora albinea TaxID=2741071 RepID=A0ABZ2LPI0_9BACT